MKNIASRAALAALFASMAGCSGGTTDETLKAADAEARGFTAFCDSITGGDVVISPTVDPLCLGCSITEDGHVADDNGYTFATVTVSAALPSQGASIRSAAQRTFAAGSEAGAFLTFPNVPSGTQIGLGLLQATRITTYLAGVQQENSDLGRLHLNGFPGGEDLPNSYVSFTTTLPFDAVELTLGDGQITVGADGVQYTWPYKVYELCSNGGVSGPF